MSYLWFLGKVLWYMWCSLVNSSLCTAWIFHSRVRYCRVQWRWQEEQVVVEQEISTIKRTGRKAWEAYLMCSNTLLPSLRITWNWALLEDLVFWEQWRPVVRGNSVKRNEGLIRAGPWIRLRGLMAWDGKELHITSH